MSGLDRLSLNLMTAATLVAAVFVPLIVKLHVVVTPEIFALAGYPNPLVDGFAWYKAILLLATATVAIIGILLHKRFFRLSDSLLLGIALLAIASALQSPYRSLTVWGVPFIFEGLPVTLAYLVMAMAASRLKPLVTEKILPTGIAVVSMLIAVYGLLELKGTQLINSPWLADLILNIDGRIFPYTGSFGSASVPFGNPNYVGLYAAMVWPFLFVLSLTPNGLWQRLLYFTATLLSFALILASLSRGGWIGGTISIALIFIFLLIKTRKVLRPCLLILFHIAVYLAMASYSESKTSDRIATVPPQFQASSFQAPIDAVKELSHPSQEIQITKVALEAGRLTMEGLSAAGQWTLRIERQYQAIKFMDESFRPLAFRVGGDRADDGEKIQILDPRYEALKMALHDAGAFRVLSINAIDVAITNWGFRIGRVGAFVTPIVAERFPLPIKDEAFSFRGFIWSYSLPLLRKTIFLGQGAGSFPFEFPNNDPIKMSAVFGPDSLVDKPHNFFISFAHTHGIIALVLFLLLFAVFAWKHLRSFLSEGSSLSQQGPYLAYLAGVSGYLICGLTADSSVGVSAIFWVLFGILIQSPLQND